MEGLNYFLPGQLWQYDTRPGEENSVLTILAIDDEKDHAIIHIRLDNINFGSNGYIQHLPYSAEALTGSVTNFIKHLDAVPDFKHAYDRWRQAFEGGKAGIWRIPVKEAVAVIEKGIHKKKNGEETG